MIHRPQAARQTDETECQLEYAVIPPTHTGLRVVNPLFTSKENDDAPFSPTSVKYEEVSMTHLRDSQPPGKQFENVDLENPPEYSRNDHSVDFSTGSPHTYTQVLPKQKRKKEDKTFQIVSTEDKYISEKGHIYHILENSTKSEKRENQATDCVS